jgi:hypothetical protein
VNGERTVKGRFAPGNQAARVSKAKSADGYDGQVVYGGIVQSGETSSDLQGLRKWRTFANMHELPPVARWAQLRTALFSGITWTAVENEAGGADARRGKELVEEGLLKARLARPWSSIAADGIHGAAANGFSIHATALGRRKDGLVVYTDIAPRPPHTIDEWHREREGDDSTPFATVQQRIANGKTVRIALEDCLYVSNANGTGSTDPRGVGMLRLIAERARRLGVYEPLEGSELASSLGGIPITRAPLQEMKAALRTKLGKDPNAVTKIAAAIAEKLQPLRDFVAKRFKDPSKLAWFELDSATYEGSDPNTITGIKKWDIEIIKAEMQGLPEIRKIISDLYLDIARMLGIEHVWMGGGDTAGTYSAHDSKLDALSASMNAEVGLFAWIAREQLARRQVRANGLDPDTATPTLVPSPIMRTDVIKAVDAISRLGMAGLPPNHPARKAVFEGVDLPWEDEEPSLMAPRRELPGLPGAGKKPGEVDPNEDTTRAVDPGEEPTEKP